MGTGQDVQDSGGVGTGGGVLRTRVLAQKPQVLLPPPLASALCLHGSSGWWGTGAGLRVDEKSPYRWQVEKVPRQHREDRDRR